MSIQSVGFRAYAQALQNFTKVERQVNEQAGAPKEAVASDFSQVLSDSLEKVNDLQKERSGLITEFAAGKSQNVHELMIAMQKASLAMNMTAAVRNKVIEAYKELSRMQF